MTGQEEFDAMREGSRHTMEGLLADKMRYRRALYVACGNDTTKVMQALAQADADKDAGVPTPGRPTRGVSRTDSDPTSPRATDGGAA